MRYIKYDVSKNEKNIYQPKFFKIVLLRFQILYHILILSNNHQRKKDRAIKPAISSVFFFFNSNVN